MRDKSYLKLCRPVLLACALLAAWLLAQLVQERERDGEVFQIFASLPSGVITERLLGQIDALPGLLGRWAVGTADVQICVGRYAGNVQLRGVDLHSYPFTVLAGAGEKQAGDRPLLVVGRGCLAGLCDENGFPISGRQEAVLEAQIGELRAQLRPDAGMILAGTGFVSGAGAAPVGTGFATGTGAISADAGYASDPGAAPVSAGSPADAEFLGIVQGGGLYMDASQMKRWLAQKGIPYGITCVELKIQGRDNLELARGALQKAGFQVEQEESLQSPDAEERPVQGGTSGGTSDG